MQADRKLLAALTRTLLDETLDGKTLRPEILAIKDIFDRICKDFKGDVDFIEHGEVLTEQGLAISPVMAAMCLEDYYRTIIYLRGLNAAIADMRTQYPDRTVRILYAGTGPYAILAIPLMAIHAPANVSFELLDINEVSLEAARSIISHLGLTNFVSAYHQMDAMNYKPRKGAMPDIIIAEIMLAGLEKEPQVAVTRALTTRMPSALFLPQSIDLFAVTQDPEQTLGTVFEFNKKMFSVPASDEDSLPAGTINIPEELNGHVFLETRVKVYGDHILNPYDSGLTTRRILPCEFKAGEAVKLVYQMGKEPRLRRAQ